MKRFIILFALIISAVGASAQSIGTLFRQYRYEEKANYMHITRFAMSIVKAFAKTDSEDKEALKALSSFRILSLEDCTSTVKQSFQKTLQTFRPTGYTPFIIAKKNDEIAYIYLKEKDGYICELLILTTDNHDGAIVQIKGKLRPDDIDAAIEKGTKNNKLKKCKLWDKHA